MSAPSQVCPKIDENFPLSYVLELPVKSVVE